MPGEQKSIWLSAAATAAATLVIAAGAAYAVVSWAMPKARHYLDDRFAAVDSKIEQSSRSAMSALTGLPSLANTAKDIETLNAKIKKTNETLDAIQKQISLATIKAGFAPLDGKLDKANTALTAIQSELSRAKLDDTAGNAALARIEKSINTVKEEIAGAASAAKLQEAVTRLDEVSASLAKLQDASTKLSDLPVSVAKIGETANTLKSDVAANQSALTGTHKSLAQLQATVKDGFTAAAAARAQIKEEMAKPAQPAATSESVASVPGSKKSGEDVIVVYVSAPAASQAAQPQRGAGAAGIPPMSVQFEKVGGTDDEGQTALIVKKLRPIISKHRDCSIAVAGHADTLGSDDVNHMISKRRAQKVVAKLKSAFGSGVRITEVAWGERKLKEWTDDETPDATNRRVDIVVRCAGASG